MKLSLSFLILYLISFTIVSLVMCINEKKLFIVFGAKRTGSSFFIDVLNTNPKIKAYEEIFLYFNKTIKHPYEEANKILQVCKDNAEGKEFVGFKVFADQLPNDIFYTLLVQPKSSKKIILWRSNILESYVSLLKGMKTRLMNTRNTTIAGLEKLNVQNKVIVDPKSFRSYERSKIQYYRTLIETFRQLNISFFMVEYEADLNSGHAALQMKMNALYRYLNVPKHAIQFTQQLYLKISNFTNVQQRILNWEQLPPYIKRYNDSKRKIPWIY